MWAFYSAAAKLKTWLFFLSTVRLSYDLQWLIYLSLCTVTELPLIIFKQCRCKVSACRLSFFWYKGSYISHVHTMFRPLLLQLHLELSHWTCQSQLDRGSVSFLPMVSLHLLCVPIMRCGLMIYLTGPAELESHGTLDIQNHQQGVQNITAREVPNLKIIALRAGQLSIVCCGTYQLLLCICCRKLGWSHSDPAGWARSHCSAVRLSHCAAGRRCLTHCADCRKPCCPAECSSCSLGCATDANCRPAAHLPRCTLHPQPSSGPAVPSCAANSWYDLI